MRRQKAPVTAILLLIAAVTIPADLAGQSRGAVRGTVTDAATGAPLENTNVYLSSTTLGTNTGRTGKYNLTNIPPGMFDVVASRIGYRVKSVSIRIASAETLHTDFSLEPVTLQGEEVQVLAHVNREWRKLLAKFKPAFLGRGSNAAGCRILNPEVLDFRMEKGTNMLIASTDSVLRIENRALGYRMYARMGLFEWDVDEDRGKFVLYPRFEAITPDDSAEMADWQTNRIRSYRGSMKHFFSSFVAGTSDSEGFSVSAGALADLRAGSSFPVSPENCTLRRIPGQPLWMLTFDRWLRVDYHGDRERLKSYIALETPPAIVDSAGDLANPLSVEVIGDWTAFRVSDMLPLN